MDSFIPMPVKRGRNLAKPLLVLALVAFAAIVYCTGAVNGLPPRASAETSDDWKGQNEHYATGSATMTGAALIDTATTLTLNGGSVAMRLKVKSADLSAATAGIYTFFSGSTVSGAHQIGQFYLAANTPRTLTSAFFRNGMRTAAGEGIYCVGPGILTYTLVVGLDASQ